METKQPVWECIGHVGDCDPIAYGGGFVYVDKTGVYPPEMTWFEPATDDQWKEYADNDKEEQLPLSVFRIVLERPRFKTLTGAGKRMGFMSSKELPASERGTTWEWHNEWYVDKLSDVSTYSGVSKFQMLRDLFSTDARKRAFSYSDLISYFGVENFDSYPVQYTQGEAYEKFAGELKLARK